jgi:hypothetical protein
MHMDESKPPTPPGEFRLRPASERAPADIDPASYYRTEEEVREGFLVALRAMGIAVIEHSPNRRNLPPGAQSRESAPSNQNDQEN